MAVRLVLIRLRCMVHLLAGPMNGTIMLMIEMTTLRMKLPVIITPVSNQPWPPILNKKIVYVVTWPFINPVLASTGRFQVVKNLPSSLNTPCSPLYKVRV